MNNNKNKIYIIFYQLGLNKDVINIIFYEKLYLEEDKHIRWLRKYIQQDLENMDFKSLFQRIDVHKNNYLNKLQIEELFKLIEKERIYVGHTQDIINNDLNQIIYNMINETYREKYNKELSNHAKISYLNIKNWIINDIIESYLENVKGDTSLLNDKDFFG